MKKKSIMTIIFGNVPALARRWGLDKLTINHSINRKMKAK